MRPIILFFIFLIIVTPIQSFVPEANATKKQHSTEKPPKAQPKTKVGAISKDPYIGAITIDAATGDVLFEDNADSKGYPASVIKLMNLLVILKKAQSGVISLQDNVNTTSEASKIGGSQVYLKETEVFTIDELLYALMVQSANDASAALSIQIAGSKEAFVDLMNREARELRMNATLFNSVHGLPPGKGQQPDVSTPRDIATLCMELLKFPETLRYTSVKTRPFRPDAPQPFIMNSHNHLLGNFQGCDGFKTGYYSVAGFSIAATATRNNMRAITVILGSNNRHVRDNKARELLTKGLSELATKTPHADITPKTTSAPQPEVPKIVEDHQETPFGFVKIAFIAILCIAVVLLTSLIVRNINKRKKGFSNSRLRF